MNENLRSILLGLIPLYVIAAIALVLTIRRHGGKPDSAIRVRFINLFLFGVACQCLHFTEEFVTGMYVRLPAFWGLPPWSGEFFVSFNLAWVAIWIVCAIGIQRDSSLAYFPVWFFTLGMIGNGLFHPLLAIATGGYFSGLVTSPIVGAIGFVLASRLWALTAD